MIGRFARPRRLPRLGFARKSRLAAAWSASRSPSCRYDATRRTKTGLTVKAQILDAVYEVGRKCSDAFRDIKDRFIRHDDVLGKWNYIVDAKGFA
jgi:hypothetical protein